MITWDHSLDWRVARSIQRASGAAALIITSVELGAYLNTDPLRELESIISDLSKARNLFLARRNEWDKEAK